MQKTVKKAIFVYTQPPIDWWIGWMTEDEFKVQLRNHEDGDREIRDYEAFRSKGYSLARAIDWDGDMREGPFVAGLPTGENGDEAVMVAWKQDNNGTTFVVSPIRLPWMEYSSMEWVECSEEMKIMGPKFEKRGEEGRS